MRMFAKFRDIITQILKYEIKSLVLKKNTKACADSGSTMKDHLSFYCLKKICFIPQHGRQITQWNSMLKDIAFKN